MNGGETSGRPATSNLYEEEVLAVHHWTNTLFSFRSTRNAGLRFESGQFVMLGLVIDGRPVMRAYSIASPSWEEELEFFSIKVEDGQLTRHLKNVRRGDKILVGKKPTGTLVLGGLSPGKTLYCLSTGTGLAPFLSIARDPAVYEAFEKIVIVHCCREVADLAYQELLLNDLPEHEFLGPLARDRMSYYATVTREPYKTTGRITDLIRSGRLFSDLQLPDLHRESDRIMICGGAPMLAELKTMLIERGFCEGALSAPGEFVVERAFVEK